MEELMTINEVSKYQMVNKACFHSFACSTSKLRWTAVLHTSAPLLCIKLIVK